MHLLHKVISSTFVYTFTSVTIECLMSPYLETFRPGPGNCPYLEKNSAFRYLNFYVFSCEESPPMYWKRAEVCTEIMFCWRKYSVISGRHCY